MDKLRAVPIVLLCGMFLFFAAGVALLSTGVYRAVESASGEHARDRVALSYLMSQLRAGDGEEGIRVSSFGDGDALILSEGAYATTLYCHEGYLMELYANKDLDFDPASGYPIVPARALTVEVTDGLFCLTVTKETGEVLYGEYLPSSQKEVSGP